MSYRIRSRAFGLAIAFALGLAALPAIGQPRPTQADVKRLDEQAIRLRKAGRYADAIKQHEKAIAAAKQVWGENDWGVAPCIGDLAETYRLDWQYDKAVPLAEDALRRFQIAYKRGEVGASYLASACVNVANCYASVGQFGRAIDYELAACEIYDKLYPDWYARSTAHLNVSTTFREIGDYPKMLKHAQTGFEVRKAKGVKPSESNYWSAATGVADAYWCLKEYDKAEPIYRDNLAAWEKNAGIDSSPHALAMLARGIEPTGQFKEADELRTRALKKWTEWYGAESDMVSWASCELATVKAYRGDWAAAMTLLGKNLPIQRAKYLHLAGGLPEREQMTFLRRFNDETLAEALAIGFGRRLDPDTLAASAEWVVNGKFLLFEVMAERHLLARDGKLPAVGAAAAELRDARRLLAEHLNSQPEKGEEEAWRTKSDELAREEERLSRALADAGGHLRPSPKWVPLADIRKALAAGEVLIEIKKFGVRDFADKGGPKGLKVEPRYVAWVIPATGAVKVIDLGPATEVEAAVARVVRNIRAYSGETLADDLAALAQLVRQGKLSPDEFKEKADALEREYAAARPKLEASFSTDAAALSKLVVAPLREAAGAATGWVVSPDGDLWAVPWAALATPDGKWLIESVALRQAVTGRDLLALRAPDRMRQTAPLVLADPNYDLGVATPADRGGSAKRLPGTRKEAAAVEKILAVGGVVPVVKYDDDATEDVLKAARSPRVLLLATHAGFTPINPAEIPPGFGFVYENPMLRSRIIFAGSNRRRASGATGEDGKLFGLEALGLDLRETELVFLSACQSALGDIHAGQSAAGLRQAFQLAGARAVVGTLWSVNDAAGAAFSTKFFTRLASGDSNATALTTATRQQLAEQTKAGLTHPYHWAAYTLTERGR